MCNCNAYRIPFASLSGSALLANQQNRDMMIDKNVISESGFRQGDLLSVFYWTWCVDEAQFKKVFSDIGLDIDRNDLAQLVDLAKTSKDASGDVTDRNGKPIKFSVVQTFSKINLSNEQIAKANCTVQFV